MVWSAESELHPNRNGYREWFYLICLFRRSLAAVWWSDHVGRGGSRQSTWEAGEGGKRWMVRWTRWWRWKWKYKNMEQIPVPERLDQIPSLIPPNPRLLQPWDWIYYSILGKEYIKAVYYHPAYLIYMQSISCEMPGWVNHKLESRLLGEISITSDMKMIPP